MKPLIDCDLVWKSVVGYEGCYLVSNTGLIYSEPRTEFVKSSRTGGHYRYRGKKYLKPRVSKAGYEQVGLYLDAKCKRLTVHRIVAMAFIPNPLMLKEVNHKDGNRLNNNVDNLEWVSRIQNSLHSTQVLGKNRGVDNAFTKLTEKEILSIKFLLELGESQTYIAKLYNVSNHAIFRIQHGYNWGWLTGYVKKGKDTSCAH